MDMIEFFAHLSFLSSLEKHKRMEVLHLQLESKTTFFCFCRECCWLLFIKSGEKWYDLDHLKAEIKPHLEIKRWTYPGGIVSEIGVWLRARKSGLRPWWLIWSFRIFSRLCCVLLQACYISFHSSEFSLHTFSDHQASCTWRFFLYQMNSSLQGHASPFYLLDISNC